MKEKTLITSITSILLSFWYLTAIVGIDVHVDHHDGEVFVVSLLRNTDCESIHPEDVCHCVEHQHGLCHEDDEDCENEISLISITGDGYDFTCDFTPASVPAPVPLTPVIIPACQESISCPRPLTDPPRCHLHSLCVLRV